jgi:hypothetical protein
MVGVSLRSRVAPRAPARAVDVAVGVGAGRARESWMWWSRGAVNLNHHGCVMYSELRAFGRLRLSSRFLPGIDKTVAHNDADASRYVICAWTGTTALTAYFFQRTVNSEKELFPQLLFCSCFLRYQIRSG